MTSTLFTGASTGRWAGAVAAALLAVTAVQVAVTHRVVTSPLVRTVAVGPGPIALAVDPRRHRVFVANYSGHSVSVLDTRSGTRLRTMAVGPDPDAVAVDARTGCVFGDRSGRAVGG